MSSIFLSHNSQDKSFARHLGKDLAKFGIKTWIDEAEIKVGDSLIEKISQGVEEMEFLAAILSPSSVDSTWVQKELIMASTMEIEHRKVKVLPILLKTCNIPIFLRDKLYVDFRRPKHFEDGLRKLLDVLLPQGLEENILSVVTNAIQAEFSAYQKLPVITLDEIDRYSAPGGSAHERVINLLKLRSQRGWIINNEQNPSTVQLLEIRLERIEKERAYVTTKEYWYLRWFDPKVGKYAYIYNEENEQTYVLVAAPDGRWLIDVNIYPGPTYTTNPKFYPEGEPD